MDNIIIEMLTHFESFIEKPHPAFGNLPVCPFAKKARLNNEIEWFIGPLYMGKMLEVEANIAIFVDVQRDINELDKIASEIELARPECALFTGHPEHPLVVNGVLTRQDPYPNIQVIKQSELEWARKLLPERWYHQKI